MDTKWSIKHCGELVKPTKQAKAFELLQSIDKSLSALNKIINSKQVEVTKNSVPLTYESLREKYFNLL